MFSEDKFIRVNNNNNKHYLLTRACFSFGPPRAALAVFFSDARHSRNSNWHLGYPDCGKDAQSPIDLAADVETIVDVSAPGADLQCIFCYLSAGGVLLLLLLLT